MSFWGRRRRSIFDLFDDIMREMEEMLFGLERELDIMARNAPIEYRGPIVYGFKITIGPDGKPVIEEFGNIRRRRGRAEISEEMEPLVDVFDYGDKVVVVAEMPGVDKDKIDVRITKDNKLIIKASNKDRKYYKEVELPPGVKPDTAKAKYKNGVLEVVIEKKAEKKEEEGIKVKIEEE